jgi:mono/diheme cytochrome c family protein
MFVRFIAGSICAIAVLVIAGFAYIYSGQFDVAASSPDSAFAQWVLDITMTRSVVAKAASVDQPPNFTDDMVKDGFEHYDEMCTVCHAGPGIDQSEISKGLNPQAPDLSDAVKDWKPRELFWIVKHGIKMTAMPSFGATHTDQEVWSIVAFIEKLSGMSADQYQQMKHDAQTDSHDHMTH